mgnify:CR=1 FL=1
MTRSSQRVPQDGMARVHGRMLRRVIQAPAPMRIGFATEDDGAKISGLKKEEAAQGRPFINPVATLPRSEQVRHASAFLLGETQAVLDDPFFDGHPQAGEA